MCKDPGLTYLNELGYNVVRYPRADLLPLDVLGRQHGTLNRLGNVSQLLREGDVSLPRVIRDVPAVAIESRRSSRIETRAALSILRPYLSALGASPGASAQFRSCRGMTFVFSDVHIDQAVAAEVGALLGRHAIDATNPVWLPYLEGDGDLFILIETLKSHRLTIDIEAEHHSGASLDSGSIQAAVGGQVAVASDGERRSVLSFAGKEPLIFGFKCLQLKLSGGQLRLVAASVGADLAFAAQEGPSTESMSGDSDAADPVVLGDGLLAIAASAARAQKRSEGGRSPSQPATDDQTWAESAPVPEVDSPSAHGTANADALYLRLHNTCEIPISRKSVRIRGPLVSDLRAMTIPLSSPTEFTIDRLCTTDDEGIVWVEGCAGGTYVLEVDGLQAFVHSLSDADLQSDPRPYNIGLPLRMEA